MSVIKTERLILRPWRDEDLEPFARMNADPRVMECFPSVKSFEESEQEYKRIRDKFEKIGWGFWVATLIDSGEFIGFIGLNQVGFEADFVPAVEIGWRLAFEHWGKGYATEGAIAALTYGFNTLGLEEIVSFTAVGNVRSRNVMEKLGMFHDEKNDFNHTLLPIDHRLSRHVLYRLKKEAHIIHISKIPPQNFQPYVEVAACYIEVDGKLLLLERCPTTSEGKTWGVPAGKIEKGETPLQGAVRELFEETGIRVSSSQMKEIGKLFVRKHKGDFVYHMFETKIETAPNIILSPEHTQHRWVGDQEVQKLPLISGAKEALAYYHEQ